MAYVAALSVCIRVCARFPKWIPGAHDSLPMSPKLIIALLLYVVWLPGIVPTYILSRLTRIRHREFWPVAMLSSLLIYFVALFYVALIMVLA